MFRKMTLALAGLLIFASCSKDDGPTVEPPRDRGEVQLESKANLTTYLRTHFYNYEEFQAEADGFDYKIVFDTIAGANAGKTPLIDQVQTKQYTFQEANYELYTLIAQEGEGSQPTFADSVFVNYTGTTLGGNKFDSSTTPLWFDLTSNNIFGFSNGIKELKAGTTFTQNPDGTTSFGTDYGIGAVFIPSGLAYFNSSGSGFGAYSDLIFTFDLYRVVQDTDNDNDGVPNWKEDINGNFSFGDRVDDSDEDGRPDFLDADDDNDGTLTIDEITFGEDGKPIYTDSNNDGTPDYLDPNVR